MSGVLNMKKIVVLGFICLILILSLLTSYLLFSNKLYILFVFIVLIYGVCIVAIVGLIKYRIYMNSKIIDPKRHLKRNYERIYLGIQGKEPADENTLDLRGYARNFYVDTLLVQRYYSFLRLNGTITVFAGKDKHYVNDNWICPLDYPLLHPVTLMENRIRPTKFLMYNPLIGMLFLWMNMFGSKRHGIYLLGEQPEAITNFCKDRNVNIEIK